MFAILRLSPFVHLLLLSILSAPLFVGCGQPTEVAQEEPVVHLKALAVLYGRYVGSHRGQAPKNEAEFKQYLQGLPQADRDSLKVTDVDSMFVSPRDSQPYEVRYGIAMPPPGPEGAPVVAWEQTGDGGQRYVATGLGDVQLVDEQKFQEMKPK